MMFPTNSPQAELIRDNISLPAPALVDLVRSTLGIILKTDDVYNVKREKVKACKVCHVDYYTREGVRKTSGVRVAENRQQEHAQWLCLIQLGHIVKSSRY